MKPLSSRLTEPPSRLQKARLDNIALVPASALPFKTQYQETANSLPSGSMLICETNMTRSVKVQSVLENVTRYFRTHGHQVIAIPFEQIAGKKPMPRPVVKNVQLAI